MSVIRDLAPKAFHLSNEIYLLPLFATNVAKDAFEVPPWLASVTPANVQVGNECVSQSLELSQLRWPKIFRNRQQLSQ